MSIPVFRVWDVVLTSSVCTVICLEYRKQQIMTISRPCFYPVRASRQRIRLDQVRQIIVHLGKWDIPVLTITNLDNVNLPRTGKNQCSSPAPWWWRMINFLMKKCVIYLREWLIVWSIASYPSKCIWKQPLHLFCLSAETTFPWASILVFHVMLWDTVINS